MPESLEIMALVNDWARAYEVPGEAIERQIPYAYAWCRSNPKRAPRSSVTRFLFNWMARAQKNGNLKVKGPDRNFKEPQPDSAIMTGEDWRKIGESIR